MKQKSINKNFDPSNKNIKVFFAPSGKQGLADTNQTVLQIARSLGVDIDSVCGGRAMCGRCQIEVSEGEFAKYGGKRARVLVKAIDDGTPLETDSGTFPLTWIDDSDKSKFISAIGKDAADYSSALKSGTRFNTSPLLFIK